ncbi:hypothetical protein GR702_04620 [Novosphingobium sp. FGD1]|uniref:Uncharacterized protein n=1 Tax=Novosphingobium silvae TaxID=2692619 RepID=A0A7X4K5K9_9SPHN|nr:hypothetical protein [Novosphingobium silvae]MYL97056.1 hypothetical protein [Novosphingobium silvae]
MTRPVRLDPEAIRFGKVRGLLECLVDAVRQPEGTPAREEYIEFLLRKTDVVLAEIDGVRAGSIAA